MDQVTPIIDRYSEYGDALRRTSEQFSESELDIVARYLEQTNRTF